VSEDEEDCCGDAYLPAFSRHGGRGLDWNAILKEK
jgi:hypothetical protein